MLAGCDITLELVREVVCSLVNCDITLTLVRIVVCSLFGTLL